jgi:hypothetical protein
VLVVAVDAGPRKLVPEQSLAVEPELARAPPVGAVGDSPCFHRS